MTRNIHEQLTTVQALNLRLALRMAALRIRDARKLLQRRLRVEACKRLDDTGHV